METKEISELKVGTIWCITEGGTRNGKLLELYALKEIKPNGELFWEKYDEEDHD